MEYMEKLLEAKNLMIQAETVLITEKGFCPYEIGYALRSLETAINKLEEDEV